MKELPILRLDNPLWQFSLRVYNTPKVADECLHLQRTQGINVNMLLFCSWMATFHQTALTTDEIRSIENAIQHWHVLAVLPLRTVREQLKSCGEIGRREVQVFHKEVLAAELHAEQIEQALLFDLGERLPPRHGKDRAHEIIAANLSKLIVKTDKSPISALIAASLAARMG